VGRHHFRDGKDPPVQLTKKFKPSLATARVICLDIPDEYDFMDPDLIQLLKSKVRKFLPTA
jgi:predicted protein tyrosine phosphatase